jgi:hypothetical protein
MTSIRRCASTSHVSDPLKSQSNTVEVCLQNTTNVSREEEEQEIVPRVTALARSTSAIQSLHDMGCFFLDTDSDEYLKQHVDYARISDLGPFSRFQMVNAVPNHNCF